jgi:hypothetical protein
MPDQLDNILNRLKDHDETPPGFLMDRILHAFENEERQDNNFVVRFNGLREFSVEVPAYHLEKISARLWPAAKTPSQPGIVKLLQQYRVAASLVLLLTAGWLLYKSNFFNKETNQELVKVPLPVVVPPLADKDTANEKAKTGADSVSIADNRAKSNREFTGRIFANDFGYGQKIKPPGENMVKLADNDLLYTIINCNYEMLKPYLEKGAPKMVVTIDQYSAVTVNEKMLDFMKVMYKTKKNQKPTAKAKKAKASLDKWKKKDQQYFDQDTSKNAIDVMDLTEFIIEKK